MAALFLIVGVLLICSVTLVLCRIWFVVLGFQRHWGWGFGLLAPLLFSLVFYCSPLDVKFGLAPLAGIVGIAGLIVLIAFIIVAWPSTRSPLFWSLGSAFAIFLTLYGTVFYASDKVPQLVAALQARGISSSTIERALASRLNGGSRLAPASTQRRGVGREPAKVEDPGVPPPAPVFRSRLPPRRVPSGEKEPSRPGVYYLLAHVRTETSHGVQHALPGEQVILLKRLPGGKMLVTVGNADFQVDGSQLTDDVEAAREAEKRDFVERGGKL